MIHEACPRCSAGLPIDHTLCRRCSYPFPEFLDFLRHPKQLDSESKIEIHDTIDFPKSRSFSDTSAQNLIWGLFVSYIGAAFIIYYVVSYFSRPSDPADPFRLWVLLVYFVIWWIPAYRLLKIGLSSDGDLYEYPFQYTFHPQKSKLPNLCIVCSRKPGESSSHVKWETSFATPTGVEEITKELPICIECKDSVLQRINNFRNIALKKAWKYASVSLIPWCILYLFFRTNIGSYVSFLKSDYTILVLVGVFTIIGFVGIGIGWSWLPPLIKKGSFSVVLKWDRIQDENDDSRLVFSIGILDVRYATIYEQMNSIAVRGTRQCHDALAQRIKELKEDPQNYVASKLFWHDILDIFSYPLPRPPISWNIGGTFKIPDAKGKMHLLSIPFNEMSSEITTTLRVLAAPEPKDIDTLSDLLTKPRAKPHPHEVDYFHDPYKLNCFAALAICELGILTPEIEVVLDEMSNSERLSKRYSARYAIASLKS